MGTHCFHSPFTLPFSATPDPTKPFLAIKPFLGKKVVGVELRISSAAARDITMKRVTGALTGTEVVPFFHSSSYPTNDKKSDFVALHTVAETGTVLHTGPTFFNIGTTEVPIDLGKFGQGAEVAQRRKAWDVTLGGTPADTAELLLAGPGFNFVWAAAPGADAEPTFNVASGGSAAAALANMAAEINAALKGSQVQVVAGPALRIPELVGHSGITNVTDPTDPGGLITITPLPDVWLAFFSSGADAVKGSLVLDICGHEINS